MLILEPIRHRLWPKNIGLQNQFNNKSCIFDLLTREELTIIEENLTQTRFKRNEYIYCEGDNPAGMQFLKEGKIKLIKEGIHGREQIIRMISEDGLIGYRSLIANEKHNATAIAIDNSLVITIPANIVFDVLLRNYNFSLALLKDLAVELGHSNFRTVTLTQKHIRGRLAESLILLKEKYGLEHDEKTLKVYLSREDLANLSNMTPSNAIRTLSIFATENVIAMDGRKIKIIDFPKLERISLQG